MTKLVRHNRPVIGERMLARSIDEACQAHDACKRIGALVVVHANGRQRRYCLACARRREEQRGGAA